MAVLPPMGRGEAFNLIIIIIIIIIIITIVMIITNVIIINSAIIILERDVYDRASLDQDDGNLQYFSYYLQTANCNGCFKVEIPFQLNLQTKYNFFETARKK